MCLWSIYMKEVRFTEDLRASVSPYERTLVPKGLYSSYIEQASKNIVTLYRNALKLCVQL